MKRGKVKAMHLLPTGLDLHYTYLTTLWKWPLLCCKRSVAAGRRKVWVRVETVVKEECYYRVGYVKWSFLNKLQPQNVEPHWKKFSKTTLKTFWSSWATNRWKHLYPRSVPCRSSCMQWLLWWEWLLTDSKGVYQYVSKYICYYMTKGEYPLKHNDSVQFCAVWYSCWHFFIIDTHFLLQMKTSSFNRCGFG